MTRTLTLALLFAIGYAGFQLLGSPGPDATRSGSKVLLVSAHGTPITGYPGAPQTALWSSGLIEEAHLWEPTRRSPFISVMGSPGWMTATVAGRLEAIATKLGDLSKSADEEGRGLELRRLGEEVRSVAVAVPHPAVGSEALVESMIEWLGTQAAVEAPTAVEQSPLATAKENVGWLLGLVGAAVAVLAASRKDMREHKAGRLQLEKLRLEIEGLKVASGEALRDVELEPAVRVLKTPTIPAERAVLEQGDE